MIIRKTWAFLFLVMFLLSFVAAQEYKIDITTTQESFEAGEAITLRVSLLGLEGKPIYDEVSVILEDSSKNKKEVIIQANELVSIDLEETTTYGQGIITATYEDSTTTGIFFINANENIEFELGEGTLTITNTGNTRYVKPMYIVIGETVGEEKTLDLEVGESIRKFLYAPEGMHTLKVIVDREILFAREDVPLSSKGFTGEVTGTVDERSTQRTGLTGGISPDEDSDEAILGYLKNSKLTYVFVLVIFGTMILLTIERRYRKRVKK